MKEERFNISFMGFEKFVEVLEDYKDNELDFTIGVQSENENFYNHSNAGDKDFKKCHVDNLKALVNNTIACVRLYTTFKTWFFEALKLIEERPDIYLDDNAKCWITATIDLYDYIAEFAVAD